MKKAIIVGNSLINNLSFLKEKETFKVACDGGYRYFLKENIEPDLFVGDFDTFNIDKLKKPKEVIKLNPIKDDTDTGFSLKTLLKRGYDEFHLYGCLGNKIDHTYANIQLLSFLLDNNAVGFLHDEKDEYIVFMINKDYQFKSSCNGRISIFSYNNEAKHITLENFKYSLNDSSLFNSYPLGVSNEFILNKEGRIKLKEGKLLIITEAKNL